MTAIPETRYACAAGDVHIAYQALGDGPVDLVYVRRSSSRSSTCGRSRASPRSSSASRASRG
jgi:hypothetical protein